MKHSTNLSAKVGAVLSLNFSPRVDLSTGGTRPAFLAIADFNGDGHMDIAVSNTSSNTISVFLGKGDGTFSAPVITSVVGLDNTIGNIVSGDFNEDGKPDLIVGTVSGANQDELVLLGKGDGTFSQQPPIPQSYGFLSAAVTDVNNDGHLDLVAGGNGSSSVFLGKGDGTFPTRVDLANPSFPGSFEGITAADFSGDGKIDVAGIDYGGAAANLDYWNGNGDGTFQPGVNSSLLYTGGSSLTHADFDQDGKQDLLVGFTNSAQIVYGNGDGTFQIATPVSLFAGGIGGTTVLSADLNLDGLPDAVITDYSDGTVNLVLNDGKGFTTLMSQPVTYTIAPNVSDVKVADFNEDGIPDVVVVNNATGKISLFISKAPSGSSARQRPVIGHHH